MKQNINWSSNRYSKDDFVRAVKTSYTRKELSKKLGLIEINGKIFHRKAKELGLDISHFKRIPRIKLKSGEKYNKLTIISEAKINKNGKYYLCKCDCGIEKIVLGSSILHNGTKSCGCINKVKFKGKIINNVGELSTCKYVRIKLSAKYQKHYFDVSMEYLWELYLKQDKKCSLTGLNIKICKANQKADNAASLDRIDSSKGYIEGNVQWVHKSINKMKMDLSQDDFINFCKLVAKNKEN